MTGHDVRDDRLADERGEQHHWEQWKDRGASLVEYALLVALIAVACMAALRQFGTENGGSINNSAELIVEAQASASGP